MTGDTEFSGGKADSVEKALKAWEGRVKHWIINSCLYPLASKGEAGIKGKRAASYS